MSNELKLIKEDFAKVFKSNGHQLLVYWEHDEDEDGGFILNQITRTTFGEANLKICLNTESAIKKVFNKYDQSVAEKMIKIHQDEINNIFNPSKQTSLCDL